MGTIEILNLNCESLVNDRFKFISDFKSTILPKIEDSGRWANIPICKPSLLTYGKQTEDSQAMAAHSSAASSSRTINTTEQEVVGVVPPVKQHHLASCLWASSGYSTRGNRFAINDGQRRLMEWITYHKLIGVDHFYLYDNSGAFSNDPLNSLRPIAELFPEDITVIDWPSQVCNNNPNNVDSVGERSSQYAAEASCRLRFGPHVQWIAQFDIDEYLVPSKYCFTITQGGGDCCCSANIHCQYAHHDPNLITMYSHMLSSHFSGK